jgi:arsenate reductase
MGAVQRVLFVCVHNSARSQMAESWMNHLCPDGFMASSAGLEPGKLNPLAVAVMKEAGIDIAGKSTRSIDEVIEAGETFDYVVTVCDEASAERCPYFPGQGRRLHMGFPDPATVEGSEEEKLQAVRAIRDAIREAVEAFCRDRAREGSGS